METIEDFFNIIDEYMPHIQLFYSQFADKKPVMELSLPSEKIYAYPYTEYMKMLGKRSQEILKKEYQDAIKSNKMVVFIRDNEAKVMKSASFSIQEID